MTPLRSIQKLESLAEQVASHKGLRLYDIELAGSGNGKVLRVYIDRQDEQSVSLDDCSEFSKAFSLLLDVEDPIEGSYHLEVSSPGVERLLKKSWHFAESLGEQITVNVRKPLSDLKSDIAAKHANRKKFKGILKSQQGDDLNFEFEGQEITIPVDCISKAKVVFDFGKKN